jgi:hypothetical protein
MIRMGISADDPEQRRSVPFFDRPGRRVRRGQAQVGEAKDWEVRQRERSSSPAGRGGQEVPAQRLQATDVLAEMVGVLGSIDEVRTGAVVTQMA